MSLELAAQHLASRGRKGDTMLVHMAPQEVSGLQALARAHGGTLTVNPDTGLPEANFLKRMLPMIIGAGLAAATGGTSLALTPGMIGLGVGGLETLRTGNLSKGLMAGLGAYGGAGLGAGLMGAGSAELGKTAVTSATGEAAKQGLTGEAYNQAIQNSVTDKMAGLSNFDKLSAGFSNPATAMNAMGGGMGAAKYGLAALSPSMQAAPQAPYAGSGPNPYEYDYDPNTQRYTRVPPGTRQRDILAPTTQMAANGGMMDSGPVEEMSNRNRMETMMANGGQMFAAGGQVNLQGTFTAGDQGGGGQFGQANANGYQAAGSGPLPGFSSSFGQMGGGGGGGGMLVGMGGTAENGFKSPGGMGSSNIGNLMQQLQRVQQQQPQQNPGQKMPRDQMAALQNQRQPMSLENFLAQGIRHPGDSKPTEAGYQSYLADIGGGISLSPGQYDNMIAPAVMPSNTDSFSHGPRPFMNITRNPFPGRQFSELTPEEQQISEQSRFAQGGIASLAYGGKSHLGDYSDGGRLLKGPGDGVSDSIPATIANKRPARLADGEFVVPARIVSELGNGSTEAGARKLYAMMDRIQKARGKTTGKNRVAVNSKAERMLPA